MSVDIAAMAAGMDLASITRRGGLDARTLSQDAHGFWQEVFDTARAVPQERPSPATAQTAGNTPGEPQPSRIEGGMQPRTGALPDQQPFMSAPGISHAPAKVTAPPVRAPIASPLASMRTSVVASVADVAVLSGSVPWAAQSDEPADAARTAHATRLWQAASTVDTPPAEFVSVQVTAEGIVLRVRNPELDALEAIRCAREVARHLAGSTGQLRMLVLNGATVYAAPSDEAPPDGPMPTGHLNIRC